MIGEGIPKAGLYHGVGLAVAGIAIAIAIASKSQNLTMVDRFSKLPA
jgi:hypothetical protein